MYNIHTLISDRKGYIVEWILWCHENMLHPFRIWSSCDATVNEVGIQKFKQLHVLRYSMKHHASRCYYCINHERLDALTKCQIVAYWMILTLSFCTWLFIEQAARLSCQRKTELLKIVSVQARLLILTSTGL